ncbi:MAG: hypothetical protein K6A78_05940 [Prevotella sp.]|nr:hypothetical protein [Prevotella sp.]
MTKNNYIIKKPYLSPSISFEDIEDDVVMIAASATTTGSGSDVGRDPEDEPLGGEAKATSSDFVFELEIPEGE